MRKSILFFVIAISFSNAFGQFDERKHASHLISDEKLDGFRLISRYYTIADNIKISNKESFSYLKDKPALDEYLRFSRNWTSYSFLVVGENKKAYSIEPGQDNRPPATTYIYNIINEKGMHKQLPSDVRGEITEMRAADLLNLKVDNTAEMLPAVGGKSIRFDGKTLSIQPYSQVKAEIIEIAKQLCSSDSGRIFENWKGTKEFIPANATRSPEYKYGGNLGLSKFLADNIKLPHDSLVNGTVYVSFTVDTTGKVCNPRIFKGLTEETDSDALRVVKLLEFNPAVKNGKKISIEFSLPIKYFRHNMSKKN